MVKTQQELQSPRKGKKTKKKLAPWLRVGLPLPCFVCGLFCLGGGGGADKAWELADVSASGAGGDLV